MKYTLLKSLSVAALMLILAGCDKNDNPGETPSNDNQPVAFNAYGDSTAIIGTLNQFRNAAGNQLNAAPGSVGGRREINWDGVPAEFTSPLLFPGNFFGANEANLPDGRKRGLVYVPAEAPLLVSDQNFSEIDTAFRIQFKAFSKKKLFSPKGTNISEVKFFVPGTLKQAYVTSFGAVFVDVDNAEATSLEFYEGTRLLGKVKVQPADKKYSFAAIHGKQLKITSVKVRAGNTVLGAGVTDSSVKDVVVLDDFIYSEPVAY